MLDVNSLVHASYFYSPDVHLVHACQVQTKCVLVISHLLLQSFALPSSKPGKYISKVTAPTSGDMQVFGRSREVERVIQVLARRQKNNPILLGEPGVGKTAIAEGLAHCIVRGFCPDGSPLPSFLTGKKILQLDVGLLISGAKERGELERRVTSMVAELQSRKDIILMCATLLIVCAVDCKAATSLAMSAAIFTFCASSQQHVYVAVSVQHVCKHAIQSATLAFCSACRRCTQQYCSNYQHQHAC